MITVLATLLVIMILVLMLVPVILALVGTIGALLVVGADAIWICLFAMLLPLKLINWLLRRYHPLPTWRACVVCGTKTSDPVSVRCQFCGALLA